MAKINNLLQMANAPRPLPPKDNSGELAALILQSQNVMADILTRNFNEEISKQVMACVAKEMDACEARMKAATESYVKALPVPERVIERVIETVTEAVEEEDEAEDEMESITVQRKDGIISTIKKGETTFDVIRNKAGFIKEIKPRA